MQIFSVLNYTLLKISFIDLNKIEEYPNTIFKLIMIKLKQNEKDLIIEEFNNYDNKIIIMKSFK